MTKKEFVNTVAHGKIDVLQVFLDAVSQCGADYCVVGGLAVNAYAEPVVSLDLDIVVAATDLEAVCTAVATHFKIERFAHSLNLSSRESDLRIQLQTDHRYQTFIRKAAIRNVLGYKMQVAAKEDVLQGKIWAYSDEERRMSKRQKDLADIARLIEAYPELGDKVPPEIRDKLK
jgi:hypothetical protein